MPRPSLRRRVAASPSFRVAESADFTVAWAALRSSTDATPRGSADFERRTKRRGKTSPCSTCVRPWALIDIGVQRAAERVSENDTPEFREQALELYNQARSATDPKESAEMPVASG